MGRQVELPAMPAGTPEKQLESLYSYLYQMAQTLNSNLAEIGGAELTDTEQAAVREIIGTGETAMDGRAEAETLKSLIIKTASFVKSALNQYRLNLLGEYVAEGKFGKYVRNTGLNVDVTPTGIQQEYTFKEIIQGLKTYEINAKNYIFCGKLREVSSIPVYGVAIGKDVVTFQQDGQEIYNDSNKVAELTADELSFYQNNVKIASYKGDRISFLYNGQEAMYISNGKIYCVNDLELATGKKLIINTNNFKMDSSGNLTINGGGTFSGNLSAAGGTFRGDLEAADGTFKVSANDKSVKAGNLNINYRGLWLRGDSDEFGFQIGNRLNERLSDSGILYNYYEQSQLGITKGSLILKTLANDGNSVKGAYLEFGIIDNDAYLLPYTQPATTVVNTYNLGISYFKWNAVYANKLYGQWMMSEDKKYDINNYLDNGVYRIDGDESNLPTGYTDTLGFLRVMSYVTNGTTVAQQMLIGTSTIYIRRGNTQYGWDAWYKFTGTIVP